MLNNFGATKGLFNHLGFQKLVDLSGPSDVAALFASLKPKRSTNLLS
jgi:hypothetical protein